MSICFETTTQCETDDSVIKSIHAMEHKRKFPALLRRILSHDGIDVYGTFSSPKLLCTQSHRFSTPPGMTAENTGRGTILQTCEVTKQNVCRDRLLYKSTKHLDKLLSLKNDQSAATDSHQVLGFSKNENQTANSTKLDLQRIVAFLLAVLIALFSIIIVQNQLRANRQTGVLRDTNNLCGICSYDQH